MKTATPRHRASIKSKARSSHSGAANGGRVELGEYIVADPLICHGQLTYKGTRIMVWQILKALGGGESVDQLVKAWGGRVTREAILETIRLAATRLLDGHGRLRHRRASRLAA